MINFVSIRHIILIGFALISASMATAAGLDHDQREARLRAIAREVLSTNGTIDRKLHDEFWSLLPSKVQQDVRSSVVRKAVEQIVVPMINAQTRLDTELWTSAKLSADAHRIIKTPGLGPAERTALAAALPSTRATVRLSFKHADDILSAAATGTTVETPEGPRFITAASADRALSHIAGTMARAKRLMDPVWTGS